jgi:outer membrane protein TolC
MKRFILILSILTISSFAFAETKPLNADDMVKLALEKNTTLINAEKTRQIYRWQIKEYYGSVYPDININASYTRNIELPSFFLAGQKVTIGSDNEYMFNVELTQNLYTGGKVGAGIKIAKFFADMGDEQKRSIKNQIIRDVRNLFYNVILAVFTVQVQEEIYNIASQYLRQMQDRFKQGLASDLMVLRQKVEVSNIAPSVIRANSIYNLGLLNLNNLIGNDPEFNLVLDMSEKEFRPDFEVPEDINVLYRRALTNRPEVNMAKLTYDMSVQNIKVNKSAFYPELSLFANRIFQGQTNGTFPDNDERYWSTAAGIKLKWNVFAGGADNAKVRQAQLEAEKNYESYQETKRLIKIDVKKYWLDYKKARELVSSQKDAVSQAKRALKATEVRFKNGLASQLELNDTVLALNKAQLLEITARNEKSRALTNIIWAIGGDNL